nr:MAG TPA: hypothetical protein [Caudoviricetes sp.]
MPPSFFTSDTRYFSIILSDIFASLFLPTYNLHIRAYIETIK